MELMYPVAIIICLILSVALFFIRFKGNTKYVNGKKVANTKYIKETEYYKEKIRKYKILSNVIKALSVICIIITSILIARPVTVLTRSEDKYNRDIILSLDLSASEDAVNLELIKKFRKIMPNIKGDRIGIVFFNTAPLVYCPLTDDYEYIDESLNKVETMLKKIIENNGVLTTTENEEFFEMQQLFERWGSCKC